MKWTYVTIPNLPTAGESVDSPNVNRCHVCWSCLLLIPFWQKVHKSLAKMNPETFTSNMRRLFRIHAELAGRL